MTEAEKSARRYARAKSEGWTAMSLRLPNRVADGLRTFASQHECTLAEAIEMLVYGKAKKGS